MNQQIDAALGDRYRLEGELGQGGMATVYLAHDLKHGRKVAVKVFHPELARTLGVDRFLREIQLAAQLHHPHIVSLIDSGEADGLLYYLMPFVDGETLRARLNREGRLALGDAVRIGREVADALAYAHRRGVVHRRARNRRGNAFEDSPAGHLRLERRARSHRSTSDLRHRRQRPPYGKCRRAGLNWERNAFLPQDTLDPDTEHIPGC